jgi:hypothetical protein
VGDFGLAPLMLTSPSEAGDGSARGKEKEDTDEPPTPTEGPAHKGVLASPGVRSAASPGRDCDLSSHGIDDDSLTKNPTVFVEFANLCCV